jgi:hypothetical protein
MQSTLAQLTDDEVEILDTLPNNFAAIETIQFHLNIIVYTITGFSDYEPADNLWSFMTSRICSECVAFAEKADVWTINRQELLDLANAIQIQLDGMHTECLDEFLPEQVDRIREAMKTVREDEKAESIVRRAKVNRQAGLKILKLLRWNQR